ncbi:MAG: DUF6886 family protein [Dehalococcoidia bacterium]
MSAARTLSGPLYHFSEEPRIGVFVPHRAFSRREDEEPLVWAIDEWHSFMYFFPRDCPRILVWPLASSSEDDRVRFMGETPARAVATIAAGWLERLGSTTVYRYELPAVSFEDLNDAGMHVSRGTIKPVDCEAIRDLPRALSDAGVELRSVESLWPLHDALLEATLHYSMIRMRNAAPR